MGTEVPGQLSIWLALAFNVVATLAFLAVAIGRSGYASLAHRSYHLFAIFTTIAVSYLFYLFFSHNYAFKYVYEYSERSQPLIYILSAFWGGQEGTYLLWLFLSALGGYLIMRRAGGSRAWAMTFYGVVNLFFLVLLVTLSPFATLPFAATDGLGLNPLLRDPWMAVHPPVIFIGYALCGIPFALALAALARNDYREWAQRAFPWAAAAALFLGAGNVLGGYWAYKTLGWGGYWAWDPVENSSLVPWVISLSLLHGLAIERRSGALRRTNLLLAAWLFLLVVYGTFLTRSGVLADFSVHSFTDLGINNTLVVFMGLFAALTLVLFVWRAGSVKSEPLDYNYFGREFSLFAAMVLLLVFGVVVLFWSSLPILSGWFSAQPRAAEIATYNSFALPLATLMAFLLAVGPFAKFDHYRLRGGWGTAAIVIAAAAVISFAVFYLVLDAGLVFTVLFGLILSGAVIYLFKSDFRKALLPALAAFVGAIAIGLAAGVTDYGYLLFAATAAMAIVSNVIALVDFQLGRWRLVGGPLTHFGFGLMLIGVLASSAYDSNERMNIPRGGTAISAQYGVTVGYEGMEHDIEFPNNELRMTLDDGAGAREIRPQLYYSQRMDGIMRKPYISRSLTHDLYLAPQQVGGGESEQHLVLAKGETQQAGDLSLRFVRFDLSAHDQTDASGTRVAAEIDVFAGGDSVRVAPAVIHLQSASGEASVESIPAAFSVGGKNYEISLEQIMADQGMIAVRIPGVTETGNGEELVLEISKKPLIILVWAGTTLILLGSLVSLVRRYGELPRRS